MPEMQVQQPPATPNGNAQGRSVMRAMADRFGMETAAFEKTLMETVMPKNTSREAVAAFLLVANEHGLNPFTREIFAFEGQGGGVRPIVSIDGWIRLVNEHPKCNGFDLVDVFHPDGTLDHVEARFYRTDRQHPVIVREYLAECTRKTEPWTRWPRRMLRHKAFIQGARYAFGFAGIEDEDEAERRVDATVVSSGPIMPQPGARTLRDLVPPRAAVERDPSKAEGAADCKAVVTGPQGEST